MKIIHVDNFGRETISDRLVAENLNAYMGDRIVALLNDSERDDSQDYYKLVDDNYVLYKREP